MAPNNGLANSKPKDSKSKGNEARTTILPKGTVEARGNGTVNSHAVITNQILEFINGEGKLSFWAEVRGFFTVWMFVTRLPGPTWVDHHPGYLMRGMAYFPIAGTLIGIFVSTFYDLTSLTLSLPLMIASIISEVTSLWMTGCFHEDGLADSADGIGGGWTSEQILRIMTDTRLGTYGCAILLLYMIAKVELIAILGSSSWEFGSCEGGGPAIIVTHTLARLVAPMMVRTRDYVDEQGPKYRFYSFFLHAKYLVTWPRVIFATFSSFAVASALYGPAMATYLILAVISMAFFSGRYADYLLGGVMGDYLGATICVTEVYLLTILLLSGMYDEHHQVLATIGNFVSNITDGSASVSTLMGQLMSSPELFSLAKFVVVITFTYIWCSNVGLPPVFVRKTVAEKGDTDEIQIALVSGEKGTDAKDDTLDCILNNDGNDFTERYDAVRNYLDSLAKPVGSLGTLEDWAGRLAALQKRSKPTVNNVACLIFVGDHGVAKDVKNGGMGCSAYPSSVSEKVVIGLDNGLAGASVLAECNNVDLRVIDVGLATDTDWAGDTVRSAENKIVGGTKNFCKGNAMTSEQVEQCIQAGRLETGKAIDELSCNVIVFGEVGIGNTTTSAALIAALTGRNPVDLCGSGASTSRDGVNLEILEKKVSIVNEAMNYHGASTMKGLPYKALKSVGGAEIAAIAGGIIEASERNVPVLIDGFICTTAAMIACQMNPMASRAVLFATASTEIGQTIALEEIAHIASANGLPAPGGPALSMKLRMGEATGALTAVPLLKSACAVLSMGSLQQVLNLEAKQC